MAANWRSSLAGPIPSHPMYEDNSSYLASRRPLPRVREEGVVNAKLHRGCIDLLFKMQAVSTGGSVFDNPSYRKAPVRNKDTTSSSDGESNSPPERRSWRTRPKMPAQHMSTNRTSHHSVRPSAPPLPNASETITSLDNDIRLIRAELKSLRRKVHANFDNGQRPTITRRMRPEFFDEESQIPPDWVERTHRRREVDEEVTYRRPNGEIFRWSSRNPEQPSVCFCDQQAYLRDSDEEIATIKARERALVEQKEKEQEVLAVLKSQRKELQREEKKRQKEEEKEDPDQPDGYRRVPDEERRAMLDLMLRAEAEVSERISRLPLILDTIRSRQEKRTLEEALDELQGAIAVYAQRKVFIRKES